MFRRGRAATRQRQASTDRAPRPVPVEIGHRPQSSYRTACAAPAIQLRFDPNGLVTTCCKSLQPLGHIAEESLTEIWEGRRRAEIVHALEADDFSAGCQRCGTEIAQEGRAISYAAIHDEWAGHLTEEPESRAWPVRMEFNLSNACNLQCVQCDGDSSSAIRLHREGRPALQKVYGDRFFADLATFLPHLDRIVFAGGEPFLGAENFRVWDMIADAGHDIDCVVVTNGTQWTPRIERLLERIPFSFVFSIDGITKDTYESIRIGADFDQVIENVERFIDYSRRVGTTASINHCLMPQNVAEFGDLLLWAEARDLFVNVSVVRYPAASSLTSSPPEVIRSAHQALEAQHERVSAGLALNRGTWDGERARLAAWAVSADSPAGSEVQTVLWFRSAGHASHDAEAAREELLAWTTPDRIQEIVVGPDERILRCSGEVAGDPEALVGEHYQALTKALIGRFGNLEYYEVLATSDDRVDARGRFGTTEVRIVSAAVRDQVGWADEAVLLAAFERIVPATSA